MINHIRTILCNLSPKVVEASEFGWACDHRFMPLTSYDTGDSLFKVATSSFWVDDQQDRILRATTALRTMRHPDFEKYYSMFDGRETPDVLPSDSSSTMYSVAHLGTVSQPRIEDIVASLADSLPILTTGIPKTEPWTSLVNLSRGGVDWGVRVTALMFLLVFRLDATRSRV